MTFQRILITGASSGLGHALALALAAPGVTLHLGGRNRERLTAVSQACGARGASVESRLLCVTNREGMAEWLEAAGTLDLVIANAGISGGTSAEGEGADQIRAIFATNLDGVLNTVLPAIDIMAAQPAGPDGIRGRIAVIASVAAFIPGRMAPAYCASKSAVDSWVVGSAPTLRKRGIGVTSLCPGFIASPMTAVNDFPMPGLMSAEKAAQIILRAVERGETRRAFPRHIAWAARLTALLPTRWIDRATGGMAGKPALQTNT